MPPTAPEKPARSGLGKGLSVQMRCVLALMLRDMMMRYGRANIGFLWIVIEPMLLSVGVMVMWSLTRSPYEHGIQVLSLVLTGYLPVTLWRHLTQAGVHTFRRSIGLLYHRHISLIDILAARMLLEFAGTTTALLAVYLILALAGAVQPVADPGLALVGWCSMGLLAAGVGVVFAVLTEYSEVTERFIQPIQYLMLPVSGCFFMVEWLPKQVQELALFNPTVHCYEMFRAGFVGEEVITHYSVWYPSLWALFFLFVGFSKVESVRDNLHTG